MNAPAPLLAVRRLKVHYPLRSWIPWRSGGVVRAVDGVDLNLYPGETLAVVGESGSGKSSLARVLAGLQPVTSGAIEYRSADGTLHDLARLDRKAWRPHRREIQLIFQDPQASLNPRMKVGKAVAEPLKALYPELSKAERESRALAMLERVGISADLAQRLPHELSGGQCQRVGIARALVVRPRVLICDEPVSALDVSVQAQIINLLMELQAEYGLAMIFIAHDLAVVRHLSQRLLVMYLGRIMEQAETPMLFRHAVHPYTRALLAAMPADDLAQEIDRSATLLDGEVPSPQSPPPGCVFVTRCPMADQACNRSVPTLRRVSHGGHAACHFVGLATPV
ncbi:MULTISPECIES: ABC transporter ATP-binding protein [Hydrocarboniphaga]|jgi:oligopeptide transport system ATP-binding protein|uniref:Oligopeptide transport ATP-binding protein OppF n=1 Tax=Hydrocarboniphaga effusa AP103 TaxID=1172194 RepID=I8T4R7_9GAMM|nr:MULTISPECIES: oligopeptide/dipeptide ABC transporter ATP-binding protein [Hydrocarboniphaga]EIT68925.1 oligopeptide transport ATP-binding protein OppF [Hydrocarboniphaga effusa AP103]MDZ4080546.1 oligopeptide/dipeptide ABC transporter ATP-binding protein [Hydrocarboniphaga sp.]